MLLRIIDKQKIKYGRPADKQSQFGNFVLRLEPTERINTHRCKLLNMAPSPQPGTGCTRLGRMSAFCIAPLTLNA